MLGRNKFLISIDDELSNSYLSVKIDRILLQKAKEMEIDVSSVLEEKLVELPNSIKTDPAGFFRCSGRILAFFRNFYFFRCFLSF